MPAIHIDDGLVTDSPRRPDPQSPLPADDSMARHQEQRLDRLIDHLPARTQASVRWLRRPSSRWVRVPAGVLLIVGGIFSILPLLGLWMLPLGLMLLADDVPLLRMWRGRLLDWIERRRPHWLHTKGRDENVLRS
jgi:hypothetical protein